MIVDGPRASVVVRPQRRQHGKALLVRGLTFGVAEQVFAKCVREPSLEVQPKGDVAVRVYLQYDFGYL